MKGKLLLMIAAGLAMGAPSAAEPPHRVVATSAPIATSIGIPAGARIVYVSGTVPDVADGAAAEGSPARFGDTYVQTKSIINKLDSALKEQGMGLGDVVMMRVFLVAPAGQARMDFAGMMRAYRESFGTAAQPNKPARSTMQVAGLVDPGWLVEIEVTAAK
jgi:enamine deaminase RidA (YjgF/YER057c/UK114 family)